MKFIHLLAQVAELLAQGLAQKPFLGAFTFGEQGPTLPGSGELNAHCNLMFNLALFGPKTMGMRSNNTRCDALMDALSPTSVHRPSPRGHWK